MHLASQKLDSLKCSGFHRLVASRNGYRCLWFGRSSHKFSRGLVHVFDATKRRASTSKAQSTNNYIVNYAKFDNGRPKRIKEIWLHMRSRNTLTVRLRGKSSKTTSYSLGPDQIQLAESTRPEDGSEATKFFPACQEVLDKRERCILDVYSSIPPA